ncbi:MAG: phosphatase [Gammaproteobacteria bacterium]|nr:phosphatase [Gammaproteobacteria bacterium]
MAIAQYDGQAFQIIGKIKEKVQLASGLDEHNRLSEEAIERGLNCLKLFGERLHAIPKSQIKIVATYTLRKAKNARDFIERAEKVLSVPIEILPGTEEARLIYNGVSHNHPDIERALVIDIGGGSTEIILGDKFEHLSLDSLSLGCVTYKRFFKDGIINQENFQQAMLNASLTISPVERRYMSNNWQHCLGSSGSIEAVHKVIQGFGFRDTCIRMEHLEFLREKLLEIGQIEDIKFEGLSVSRVNTFTTGLVILMALFKELKIPELYISNASLREGILLELADELQGNDNRDQTVASLISRFNIDRDFGQIIRGDAETIFHAVCDTWGLYDPHYKNLLDWSTVLHEIGLSISYSKMRFHSAHIIQYADMPGFSLQTQESLAAIILAQNKKLYPDNFENKYEPKQVLLALAQILRLAILFNIKRDNTDISTLEFIARYDNELLIKIPQQWADEHQLIMFEMEKEKAYLAYHGIQLSWQLT